MQRMQPVVSNGKFMGLGEKIRLPDDVTIGYVIGEYYLQLFQKRRCFLKEY